MAYLGNTILNKFYSFQPITAAAGQTVFNATYTPGLSLFFLTHSGATKLLQESVDVTATDGSTITLASAASAGDVLSAISMAQFSVANALTQAVADGRYKRLGPPVVGTATGLNYAYVAGDQGQVRFRSNSGSPMVDTLPGTTTGVLGAGWETAVFNKDATGFLAIGVGSGATLDGGSDYIYIGPGQSVTLWSDGVNYWTRGKPVRCRLTTDTNIYVATTGSNSNPGIPSSPFLTIQKAVDIVGALFDLNGFTVTIWVADGTYTAGATIPAVVGAPKTSAPAISIRGNTGAPANCIVSASAACFNCSSPVTFQISGFQMTSSTDCAIAVQQGATCRQGSNRFGACASGHLISSYTSLIVAVDGVTIYGNSPSYAAAFNGGVIIMDGIGIITSGTPAFSTAFVVANNCGNIYARNVPFSGSGATGPRYKVITNGNIDTNTGGANYFPGNAAGSNATGGNYI